MFASTHKRIQLSKTAKPVKFYDHIVHHCKLRGLNSSGWRRKNRNSSTYKFPDDSITQHETGANCILVFGASISDSINSVKVPMLMTSVMVVEEAT